MSIEKRRGRALKHKVLALLESDNFEQGLNELGRWPARKVVNSLFSFLLGSEERTRWRAITALGVVVASLAEEDMESARVIMRRFMWMLNDESGGIGWGAPEAMAEIIASHEGLAREYVRVLLSYVNPDGNFLEYEPLQRGAVWSIGRVAQVRPDLVQGALPYLMPHLASSDATLRGLAVWTLGMLGAESVQPQLEALLEDEAEISLYLDRRLVRRRVREVAREALAAISS